MKKDRLGEEKYNYQGCLMKIIEYNNANDLIVEFQDEYKYKKKCHYTKFEDGGISNYYFKSLHGIGCLGNTKTKNGNITKKSYSVWSSMIERCYTKKYKAYEDCLVCDEWLCFENFEKWYDENYYEVEKESTQIDKDILYHNNKTYSANNCIFVPQSINTLFTKRKNGRGRYKIGVQYNERLRKYIASCSVFSKEFKLNPYLGCYKTEEEAFVVYKEQKEKIIKMVAEKYKDKVPIRLYVAMLDYSVDKND